MGLERQSNRRVAQDTESGCTIFPPAIVHLASGPFEMAIMDKTEWIRGARAP